MDLRWVGFFVSAHTPRMAVRDPGLVRISVPLFYIVIFGAGRRFIAEAALALVLQLLHSIKVELFQLCIPYIARK